MSSGLDALAVLRKMDTCTVSDALDSIGVKCVVRGLRPLWGGAPKIVGPALTIHIGRAGVIGPDVEENFGVFTSAIEVGRNTGSVIVVEDQTGDDAACWGGLLSLSAREAGIAGVVVDGNCRDVNDIESLEFGVYARGSIPMSGRTRVAHVTMNIEVEVGGMPVRPRDVLIADGTGVVVVPFERLDEIASITERLATREAASVQALRSGESPERVLLASTRRG